MTTTTPTNPGAPRWRTPAIIGGVVALAVVVGLLFALYNSRQPTASDDLDSTASPTPSTPVSPSAPATDAPPTASPEPTPIAAPEDWTQVHTIGDGSTRTVGGEIAWGDAGFLVIAKEFEGGEGGPRPTGFSFWRSADGQTWAELPSPVADANGYSATALTGAADGSYVFHAHIFDTDTGSSSVVSLRSTDGETWEPIETGLPGDVAIQAIEEGPAGYLLVAGQTGNSNPTLWLSSDALTWELVHEFSQDQQYVQLHDGDGGAEGYVVIGRRIERDGSSSYERFAFASADGREWVEQAAPFGPDNQDFVWEVAVSSHGGDWLATLGHRDETTQLWASADGLTWTEAGSLDARNLTTASAGLFEEIGAELILAPGGSVFWDGTPGVWSSTDGTTWSPIDLGADAYAGDVAVGDGVVAMTGTIPGPAEGFTSTAGIWIRASD
jgi:hypothetical protein